MTPQEYLQREIDIQEAHRLYSKLEIGEAYKKYKEERGEKAELLYTGDKNVVNIKQMLKEMAKRLCDREGCDGEQILESVCGGCVEGKAGYKSKWTCSKCLHRELSKKDYLECLRELSSES